MIRPALTLIAGPNGSGRTSLLRTLEVLGVDIPVYHNADDIARSLSGAEAEIAAEAQARVRLARDAAIRNRTSFTYETVLSHPSHLQAMRTAVARGFYVRMIFITTADPQVNVDRVADRVAKGGHPVPEDRIRGRWQRTMDQLAEAVQIADESLVFDNNRAGHHAEPVAHVMRQFVRQFAPRGLTWPETKLFAPLRERGYIFERDS